MEGDNRVREVGDDIGYQHEVRESPLLQLLHASGSGMRLGRKRGREERRIDQKEGRTDQPPLKAAKVLIKMSLCTQLGLGAGFKVVCETKPSQQAVSSGGKWLLAFFSHLFGKARAVNQPVEDACVLSQHLPAALAAAPAPCLLFCCLGKALTGARLWLCPAAGALCK